MPRVPQQGFDARPISIPRLPDANLPRTTTAGTLADILAGGVAVSTRALEFQAASQSLANANTINDIRHAEEQARRQEIASGQLAAAEARIADEDAGAARRKFAEDRVLVNQSLASGEHDAMIGRVVDPTNAIADAEDFAHAATVGASDAFTRAYLHEAKTSLASDILARQAVLQGGDRAQSIQDLQSQGVVLKDAQEFRDFAGRNAERLGLTESQFHDQITTKVLQARAAVGDPSVVQIANELVTDLGVRSALVNQAQSVSKEKDNAQVASELNAFSLRWQNARRTSDVAAMNELSADLTAYQATHDKSRNEVETYQNEIRSSIDKIAQEQQTRLDEANAARTHDQSVRTETTKILSGNWWDANDVEVQVGSVKVKTTVADMRQQAFSAASSAIDAIPNVTPEDRLRLKIQAGFGQNYVPNEYKGMVQSGVQQMQALGQAVIGKERVVPNETIANTLTMYREVKRISPGYAAQLFTSEHDRAFLDGVSDYLAKNNNDLQGAIAYVNSPSNASGGVSFEAADKVAKSMADSDADFAATGSYLKNALVREANLGTARGKSPAQALADAKELLTSNRLVINGYSTVVLNREWMPMEPGTFDEQARLWFKNLEANYADQNIHLGKPIAAKDMRLDQDENGYWRVRDARNGDLVKTNGNLALSVFTTRELVGVAAKAKMRDIQEKANKSPFADLQLGIVGQFAP